MIELWHASQTKWQSTAFKKKYSKTPRLSIQHQLHTYNSTAPFPEIIQIKGEKVKFYLEPERIRILKFDCKQDLDCSRVQCVWLRSGRRVDNFRPPLSLCRFICLRMRSTVKTLLLIPNRGFFSF